MEKQFNLNSLVSGLIRIGHKDLSEYKEPGLNLLGHDASLMAHTIAWNAKEGEIRDSKVALPIISLRGNKEYHENAVAHLLQLDPKNLVRALYFHKGLVPEAETGGSKLLKHGIVQYLRVREQKKGWWDRTVLQHRKSMKTLYALNHVKPNDYAQAVLFKKQYPDGSVFMTLKGLSKLDPMEAAGKILMEKIPFIVAIGALGGVTKNTDVLLALIQSMSGAELITNSKMLQRLGVMDSPALKSAFEEKILQAKKDKKVSSLKTGKAIEAVTDKKVKAKLEALQESKVEDLKKMEGDWLVLGDKSGSMHQAIATAREIAAFLTKTVQGKVYLIFFDTMPRSFDITGKSLEEIKTMTRGITAGGGTSIGCGLQALYDKDIVINGIAICSDGGENTPPFLPEVYKKYEAKFGFSPNVYLLRLMGDSDALSRTMAQFPYERIDVDRMDYYSMPNLAKVLKSSRFTLIDEILQVPLLTINDVIGKEV